MLTVVLPNTVMQKVEGATDDEAHEHYRQVVSSDHAKDSIYLSVSLSVGDVIRPKTHCCINLDGHEIPLCPSSVFVVYAINDEHLDHIYPKPCLKHIELESDKQFSVLFLEYVDMSSRDGLSTIDLIDYAAVHFYTIPADVMTLTMNCRYAGNIKYRLDNPVH